jgi:hypothetical protein
MKRSAVLASVLSWLLLAAGAASAATVTISADFPVVFVGDTITLTVNTDSQGELIFFAQAQVSYDPALVSALSATQILGGPSFIGADLDLTDLPGWKTALNQISGVAPIDTGTTVSSTLTFLALAPGVATFTLGSGNPAFFAFTFGSAAPGNSVSVTIVAVPEPATATLLGVGLLALSAARRR